MRRFSPTDAAFEGFRLTRENPLSVALWAVLWFAVLLLAFYRLAAADVLVSLQSFKPGADLDQKALVDLFARCANAIAPAFAAALVVQVLIQSAIMRMVFKPGESSFGHLRVGLAELRLLLVQIALMMLGAALWLFILTLAAVSGSTAVVSLGLVIFFAALVAILTRLSLAAPMTFVSGRVKVFQSWGLTKGLLLPLLGAYALAFLFNVVVGVLGGVIGEAVTGVLGVKSAPSTLADVLSLGFLIFLAVQAILQAMASALLLAPPARVYQALSRV